MRYYINIVLGNYLDPVEQFLRNKVDFYNDKRYFIYALLIKQNKKNSIKYNIYRLLYKFFSQQLYFYTNCLLDFLNKK